MSKKQQESSLHHQERQNTETANKLLLPYLSLHSLELFLLALPLSFSLSLFFSHTNTQIHKLFTISKPTQQSDTQQASKRAREEERHALCEQTYYIISDTQLYNEYFCDKFKSQSIKARVRRLLQQTAGGSGERELENGNYSEHS